MPRIPPERGKRLALLTASVGVVVLVLAGIVGLPWMREYRAMSQVRDKSEFWRTRIAAARELRDLHSTRAIPVLIRAVEMHPCKPLGQSSLDEVSGVVDEVSGEFVSALLEILKAQPSAGLNDLRRFVRDDNWQARAISLFLLGECFPDREETNTAIQERLSDENRTVRNDALDMLFMLNQRESVQPDSHGQDS